MCPHCKHELAAKDLIPVLSWLSLGGKCRYCDKPISRQYPVVEGLTAALFVASYAWWPVHLGGVQTAVFIAWLALLTGLVALLVYDIHWMLLPNRIIYPLGAVAGLMAVLRIIDDPHPGSAVLKTVLAVAVGGGVFYLLFQVSNGKWIGGGDVKLGWLLGLAVGTPSKSLLLLFAASLLGSLFSLPLLIQHKANRNTTIPFGPFLIIAAILVQLFGADVLSWYRNTFIY